MSTLDPVKKYTFHPARFNTTQELAVDIAKSCVLKPSVSPMGYITVYYTDLEFLLTYFWSLGINQKVKTTINH